MEKTLPQKLRIKHNDSLLLYNAPPNFETILLHGLVNFKIQLVTKQEAYNQVHWFVKNKYELEKDLEKILRLLKPDILIWIYYPKQTAGLQTDLTRDKGWEKLLEKGDTISWVSLISFSTIWSGFGMRLKTKADILKQQKPPDNEIQNWINPTTKEVKIPHTLQEAFKKNNAQENFFNTLAYSHRKEYVAWIVSVKRPETKEKRILKTIEMLGKQWKNPQNL